MRAQLTKAKRQTKRQKERVVVRTLNKYFVLFVNCCKFWSIFHLLNYIWVRVEIGNFVNDFMCLRRPLINNILKIMFIYTKPLHPTSISTIEILSEMSVKAKRKSSKTITFISILFFSICWYSQSQDTRRLLAGASWTRGTREQM